RFVAEFEVPEPAAQHRVHGDDDLLEALAVVAAGATPDDLLEFSKALLARPAAAVVEAIPQELKAVLRHVRHARLVRVERQAGFLDPASHLIQRASRFLA